MHLRGLTLLFCLTAMSGCAGTRASATAPGTIPAPGGAPAPAFSSHPLEPDFRRLGEAFATFWRAEERFPSGLEELRAFADEHALDLRLTHLSQLAIRSKLYGRVLTGQVEFPHPGPVEGESVRSTTVFEIDATDPEAITVSFDAATPDGQAYLEAAYRAFSDRFTRR